MVSAGTDPHTHLPAYRTRTRHLGKSVTRPQIVDAVARETEEVTYRDVDQAVRVIIEQMSASLERGERVEIRGFGAFDLPRRAARTARNPETGEAVRVRVYP